MATLRERLANVPDDEFRICMSMVIAQIRDNKHTPENIAENIQKYLDVTIDTEGVTAVIKKLRTALIRPIAEDPVVVTDKRIIDPKIRN